MTKDEAIIALLDLGFRDISGITFSKQYDINEPALFYSFPEGAVNFYRRNPNDVWRFRFDKGVIYYWSSNREWEPVEDGLSLESILILYKDIFQYEIY